MKNQIFNMTFNKAETEQDIDESCILRPDGAMYQGEWKENTLNGKKVSHGYGIVNWPDETNYEGNWSNGLKHGFGKQTFINGNLYEGEWKNDIIEGHGSYSLADGSYYIGAFINNLFHG